ncbi:MAG: hypothetical protein JWR10_4807 [Rubritepida sp.]|nr:hypothetical protein [Rubritepida sp.]
MARPYLPGHHAVPLQQWPPLDQAAWAIALNPDDPDDDEIRHAVGLRPRTHDTLVGAYGRWLAYLHGQGIPLAGLMVAAGVTPEHAKSYVPFLRARGCASVTISSYLGHLHAMVRYMDPERDWQWLCRLQARMNRRAEPSRLKATRIVPQRDLFRLGCDLMQRALDQPPLTTTATSSEHDPALLFRDGFAIALLSLNPLRRGNFLGLEIGRHLIRDGEGRTVLIPPTETKNKRSFELPFPDCLEPALELYLALYRPRLIAMRGGVDPARELREAGQKLWIARSGMPMSPGALTKALARHCLARFGHTVNAHLFRDCAVTSLGDEVPEDIRMAARLLGHASFSTTERHYILALGKHAFRRHEQRIHEMQGDTRPRRVRRDGTGT